jgi:hypothetical protein
MGKMKPSTVIKKWEALCEKIKNDKTKRKAPGRQEAQKHAAMCGMRSMGEVYCAANMDQLKIPYQYEAVTLTYQHAPQKYTPDFILPNGFIVEFKGKMTAEVRKKLVSIKRSNPEKKIGIVFQKANNKLSSRPNATRYWEWAEANGYLWSEAYVPKAWTTKKVMK